jgi:hypothetical protein
LCFRAPQDSRRFYDTPKFTPEQVRQDDSRPGKQTKIFYGGKRRKTRYKDVGQVYWRLPAPAEVAPQRLPTLLPRPGHAAAEGDG